GVCVTGTVTRPSACAGVVAVIAPLFTTLTFVAATPPILTVAPVTKFVPEIVTAVPPAVEPEFGETPVTVGAGPMYVNPLASEPLCVSGFVTTTVKAPAAYAAVVAGDDPSFPPLLRIAATPPLPTC